MKNRQYSVKVFETTVEDEKSFMEFFDTHQILFKDHLIVIQGKMSETIKAYLEIKSFHFIHNFSLPIGRSRKALEEEFSLLPSQDHTIDEEERFEEFNELQTEVEELQQALAKTKEALKVQKVENEVNQKMAQEEMQKLSKKLSNPLTVLDKRIRSGRELNIEGDLLLLNRVNSGATINTTGSLIITQVVEGAIRCNGKFMMITVAPTANIIFNGVEVDNSLLKEELNKIELKDREIFITPVIKKEINWV